MKTRKFFSLLCSFAALVFVFASCEKQNEPTGPTDPTDPTDPTEITIVLSPQNPEVQENASVTISATVNREDAIVDWSVSDTEVATIEPNGNSVKVTGVKLGIVTITASYEDAKAETRVKVNADKGTAVLLQGSDYYIFQMDATTFNQLDVDGKVTSDMRSNGAFEGPVLVPEDATRVNYIWNKQAEIAEAPQTGANSFGLVESWFSIAAASPTPEGGWGNISGGLGIASATDPEIGKLQNLKPDHVFVVVLKGKYTPATSLQIAMTPPAGGDNITLFEVTDSTGKEEDGDWEVFTLTYAELLGMGIDLSQPITAEAWYPWAYTANGAGNRVDVDAVFFYLPGE